MNVAERVDLEIRKLHLSRRAFAIDIGVPPSTFQANMENGGNFSFETLCKIADHFNVSTDYLLGRTSTKSIDLTVQEICAATGLSELSLKRLKSLQTSGLGVDCANKIIESLGFQQVCYYLIESIKQIIRLKEYSNKCAVISADKLKDFENNQNVDAVLVPTGVVENYYLESAKKYMFDSISEIMNSYKEEIKLCEKATSNIASKSQGINIKHILNSYYNALEQENISDEIKKIFLMETYQKVKNSGENSGDNKETR